MTIFAHTHPFFFGEFRKFRIFALRLQYKATMARKAVWQDDYWLLLMQIYLRRPVGMKSLYSRDMVELSLELHIPPRVLRTRMQQLATLETPRIERIWKTYAKDPQRLARAVRLMREMKGFGAADDFYEGVELQETFERDFRPLAEDQRLTTIALIMVLDLYFRLSPITMVPETPEVVELAKLVKVPPSLVADVLQLYQRSDPYLNRKGTSTSPLLPLCRQVWERYADQSEQLPALAAEYMEYYRS